MSAANSTTRVVSFVSISRTHRRMPLGPCRVDQILALIHPAAVAAVCSAQPARPNRAALRMQACVVPNPLGADRGGLGIVAVAEGMFIPQSSLKIVRPADAGKATCGRRKSRLPCLCPTWTSKWPVHWLQHHRLCITFNCNLQINVTTCL